MAEVVVQSQDGGQPERQRTWWEIMHPEGSQGSWRDLPRLLGDAVRLVWSRAGVSSD